MSFFLSSGQVQHFAAYLQSLSKTIGVWFNQIICSPLRSVSRWLSLLPWALS